MTQLNYADARRHPRARLTNSVRLTFASTPGETKYHTANVSESGMFVGSISPPPIGTMVRFSIDFGAGSGPSSTDQLVEGIGHVVWLRLKSKRLDEPCGMGIEFGALAEKSRNLLRSTVMQALKRNSIGRDSDVSLAAGG